MRTITVRQSLSWLRKQAAKRESQLIEMNNEQFVDPSVFEQLEKEEIIKLIQKLPGGYRTVFNMKIIEGYPHKEIAAILGITESASRSQLSRAKTLLRQKLQGINNKNFGVL
jgi:RNA polymerase sigma-70 factor (ECF subfamily)